jgi:hypothetical protein
MGLFSSLSSTAAALLSKYGQPATLTKVAEGAYDPATGKAALVETSIAVSAYMGSPNYARKGSVDSDNAHAYIPGSHGQPGINDRLTIRGTAWTVVHVSATSVEGGDVIYRLTLRAGSGQ